MTVPVQVTYNVSTANGVSTSFPCDFVVQLSGDLVVKVDGVTQTYPSDYTITNLGTTTSAIVVFASAPANLAVVVRERILPLSRTSYDYQQSGDFLAAIVNADLDRVWMAMQQLDTAAGLSLRFPVTSAGLNTELPPLADGEGWVWDDDAGGLVAAPFDTNALATAVASAAADAASAAESEGAAASAAADAVAAAAAISPSVKVSAYKLSNQTTPSNSFQQTLAFSHEIYDTENAFDVTTQPGTFTAPAAGYYRMTLGCWADAAVTWAVGKYFIIELFVAGSAVKKLINFTGKGVAEAAGGNVSATYYMLQNQTMTLRVSHDHASSVDIVGGAANFYVFIERVL